MLDAYLTALDVLLPVVESVPVWGPLLLVGLAAVLVWRRAARRTVSGHGPGAARTCADTSPDTDTSGPVTCTDTRPDMSGESDEDRGGQ